MQRSLPVITKWKFRVAKRASSTDSYVNTSIVKMKMKIVGSSSDLISGFGNDRYEAIVLIPQFTF